MRQSELAITKTRARSRAIWRAVVPAVPALAVAALTLYAYRELFARPFAADDYQWLLAVRGLSFGQVVRQAFDAGAQSHFYRPLVWLLFWAQGRAFGFDPQGYHAVSLILHLLNALLAGWLFYRLAKDQRPYGRYGRYGRSMSLVPGLWSILVGAVVALHPAPFEAVVWISAQSELLAAALLLAALHLWLLGPTTNDHANRVLWSLVFRPWSIGATLALGLALLAKESAVIGLPLLILLGREASKGVQLNAPTNRAPAAREPSILPWSAPYLLPTLVTLAYVALQVSVERRNYLLEQGGYGLGPQIILNPLRSLALIVAPLPGTEHADNAWLVPAGAIVAVALLALLILGSWRARRLVFALGLTLLPTAPFVSPPDSRYLYLPVIAAALLVALLADQKPKTKDQAACQLLVLGSWSLILGRFLALGLVCVTLALGSWAIRELHVREWRFSAGAGPGGSLWRLAASVCAAGRPDRMVLVEPPIAPPHAEAIVELACGADVAARIVGRDQVEDAIEGRSVVVEFPGGSAQVVRETGRRLRE